MNISQLFPHEGNRGRSSKNKNQSKALRGRREPRRRRPATVETDADSKPPKRRTGRPRNPPRVNRPPAALLPRPSNSSPDFEPCLTPTAAPIAPGNHGCMPIPHGKGPPSGHPLPMPLSQHQPSVSANGRRRGLQPLDLTNLGPDEMTGSVTVLGQYSGVQSFEFPLFGVLGSPHWPAAFMDPGIAEGLGLPIYPLESPRTFLTPYRRLLCTHEVIMQCKSEDFGLQLGPLRAFLFGQDDPPPGPPLILPMECDDRVQPQNVYSSINNDRVVEQHPFALPFLSDASPSIGRRMGLVREAIPQFLQGEDDHGFSEDDHGFSEDDHGFSEGLDTYCYNQAFVENDSGILAADHFGSFGEIDSYPSYGELGFGLDLGGYDNGNPSWDFY